MSAFWNIYPTNCPKKCNFWPKLPPTSWYPVQVFVRSQTNATVSSLIWSTNYTQSMREVSLLIMTKKTNEESSNAPRWYLPTKNAWDPLITITNLTPGFNLSVLSLIIKFLHNNKKCRSRWFIILWQSYGVIFSSMRGIKWCQS